MKKFLFLLLVFSLTGWLGCASFSNKTDAGNASALKESSMARKISGDLNAADIPHPKFANPDARSSDNFVKIKAGTFKMGTPSSETNRDNDETLHTVTITRDFEMQATVVTQAQYFLAMEYNPSGVKHRSYCPSDYVEINGTSLCPNHPVVQVSWNDAQDFINKLNATDADFSYRLPTEAETEYAIRAGTQSAYWFGDSADRLGDYAWFNGNSGNHTHAVGTKPANPWGLYDASGNVWQWVSDRYSDKLPSSHQTDPVGAASDSDRMIRGGGWYDGAQYLRSGFRNSRDPGFRYDFVGFRLVRTAK